jgi:hypothetical protein
MLEPVKPLTCTIRRTQELTGWGRSKIYGLIADGVLDAVKDGTRTLVIYESIERRAASLQRVGSDRPLKMPAPLKKAAQSIA